MNAIIGVWNTAGKGKSSTLRELAKLIMKEYPNHEIISTVKDKIPDKRDFQRAVKINDVTIGFISKGDPSTGLKSKLERYAKDYNCNLIICTTRTYGKTKDAVKSIAEKYKYETIWTSTYEISDSKEYKSMNALKAKHLLDLIQQLGFINPLNK